MNPHIEIKRITEELRSIYNTNEGPRLIAEMIEEFPNPRALWNEPAPAMPGYCSGAPGGWGLPATCSVRPAE